MDLFPWQHSGLQFKRTWPIGETEEVLRRRLGQFIASSEARNRKELFKETRDRKVDGRYRSFSGGSLLSLAGVSNESDFPQPQRYCYRQFDRQYALIDSRFGDFLRPPLVLAAGPQNVFFSTLTTNVLGFGPAIGVSADLPDLHVFCGRGGKDIIPLYRRLDGTEANVTKGLLDVLGTEYGRGVGAEELAAYVYAMLVGHSYTRRFWNELETPGARVPITRDGAMFAHASRLGERLIWLHTYAERFRGQGRGPTVPAGQARCIAPVSDDPARYPEDFGWNDVVELQEVTFSGQRSTGLIDDMVGTGRFGGVAPEAWKFEVSGLVVGDPQGRVAADRSQSLWDKVRARRLEIRGIWPGGKGRRGFSSRQGGRSRAFPDHLLCGAMVCASCGRSIGLVSGKPPGYYGCLAARSGGCDNKVRVNRDLAERVILGDVERLLADPPAIRYVYEQMEQVLAQLNSDVPEQIRSKTAQLGTERRRLDHLVDFVAEGRVSPGVRERLAQTEGKVALLEAQVAELNRSPTEAKLPSLAWVEARCLQLRPLLQERTMRSAPGGASCSARSRSGPSCRLQGGRTTWRAGTSTR